MQTNVLINNKVIFDMAPNCSVQEIHETIHFKLVSKHQKYNALPSRPV